MLDKRPCNVNTAEELNNEIKDILALDSVGRGDEICGTLYVDYTDDSVKKASLLPKLTARGVTIEWLRK